MAMLHHVSLLTGSAAATRAYYEDRLGLRLVKNTVNQEDLKMRHLFFGDRFGTPGTVISFFVIDHLGPRYDDGDFLTGVTLGIPDGSAAYWTARLGGLTVTDPNDVAITLVENGPALPAARQVAGSVPGDHQITGLVDTTLETTSTAEAQRFSSTMLADDPGLILRPGHAGTHRFGRGSMDHVAFVAPDKAALDDLAARAAANQFVIEKFADRGWFTSLYVLTPGGVRIEFATPGPGFTLDDPVETLGQGLGLPPFLEAKRPVITAYFHDKGVDFS
ncbi:VOC family protein [Lacticaseibacillus mingshuiensis]|uniref:VOC family protein n=1 Tax=Lacticaseibacillus mingshuiensis TaxID=2799574 RepID=A0ABW4CIW8_9LACO|nr:VOC family protein [Lacticaseibacillus mingshuiensis]